MEVLKNLKNNFQNKIRYKDVFCTNKSKIQEKTDVQSMRTKKVYLIHKTGLN